MNKYQQCRLCDKRRVVRGMVGGYSPIDRGWIETGEWTEMKPPPPPVYPPNAKEPPPKPPRPREVSGEDPEQEKTRAEQEPRKHRAKVNDEEGWFTTEELKELLDDDPEIQKMFDKMLRGFHISYNNFLGSEPDIEIETAPGQSKFMLHATGLYGQPAWSSFRYEKTVSKKTKKTTKPDEQKEEPQDEQDQEHG